MNHQPWTVNRREFLKIGGLSLLALLHRQALGANPPTHQRRLVLLEMNGGNDGLNTLVPYGDDAYYQARTRIAIAQNDVLALDSQFGLHPNLQKLRDRYQQNQVAIVRGVGHPTPDLSHFAMADYWRSGHLRGMAYTEQTGWIGRSLDRIVGNETGIVGLSIGWDMGPAMYAQTATTAAADGPWSGYLELPWQLTDDFRAALLAMTGATVGDTATMKAARTGLANGMGLGNFLKTLIDENGNPVRTPKVTYPDSYTATQLKFAADLLVASPLIQGLHIGLPMEFDHHVDQRAKQDANFAELDAALDAFLADLTQEGLFDDTVVMTASEFGRRVEDNAEAGTDHGTASCLFVVGASTTVNGGMHGTAPSLTDLDENGNLKATTWYTDVLAEVTRWLGAPDGTVTPNGNTVPNLLKA